MFRKEHSASVSLIGYLVSSSPTGREGSDHEGTEVTRWIALFLAAFVTLHSFADIPQTKLNGLNY
jgi:hypothetical protein